jgi:hypothetical protein
VLILKPAKIQKYDTENNKNMQKQSNKQTKHKQYCMKKVIKNTGAKALNPPPKKKYI